MGLAVGLEPLGGQGLFEVGTNLLAELDHP
jgi:hypothetical protein